MLEVKCKIAPTLNTELEDYIWISDIEENYLPLPEIKLEPFHQNTSYFSSSYSDIISNKIVYSYSEQNFHCYYTEKEKDFINRSIY